MESSLLSAPAWAATLTSAWRWAVRPFDDKEPFTTSDVWVIASPLPVVLLQIHLLLRYDPRSTRLLRASLVPIVSLLALRSAFALYFNRDGTGQLDGRSQHINMTLGCYAIAMVVRSLEFGLAWRSPRLKACQTESNGTGHRGSEKGLSDKVPAFFPGTKWPLEIDLLLNVRGVGWEHGLKEGPPALPVPTYTSRERRTWIRKRLAPVTLYFLAYDAIFVLISERRFNCHAGGRLGGSLFDCSRGSFGVAGPYLICIAYGLSFVCVLHSIHSILACLSVGLLNDLPSRWEPPITSMPWLSTSIAEFWAKRWHQYLRITFMTVGYWPVRDALRPIAGRRIANIAAICGAFLASGLLHEFGRAAMMPSPSGFLTRVTLFFVIQPAAIFGEQVFQHLTGRDVGGWWGWLWTMTWLLSTSPLLLEAMSQGGYLVAHNQTLDLTRRPILVALDWWDRTFRHV